MYSPTSTDSFWRCRDKGGREGGVAGVPLEENRDVGMDVYLVLLFLLVSLLVSC